MNLQFVLKSVYGVDRYYPFNPVAKSICEIAERKTLEKRHINALNLVGYDITIAYIEDAFNNSKNNADTALSSIAKQG